MPILETRILLWPDEQACAAMAQEMAAKPALRNATVELEGTLGVGKTSFVRHLLRASGVNGRVKSPSYAVVEPYLIPSSVSEWHAWHFDFYRFTDPHEWEDAGFRDIFGQPGLKLSEWPDRVRGLLPQADMAIHITVPADEMREVECIAYTAIGLELLP